MTLKRLRENAGLRQIDVARILDIEQAAVSKWETGKHNISRKYHQRLARLYHCTVDELFSEAGVIPTPVKKEDAGD